MRAAEWLKNKWSKTMLSLSGLFSYSKD